MVSPAMTVVVFFLIIAPATATAPTPSVITTNRVPFHEQTNTYHCASPNVNRNLSKELSYFHMVADDSVLGQAGLSRARLGLPHDGFEPLASASWLLVTASGGGKSAKDSNRERVAQEY